MAPCVAVRFLGRWREHFTAFLNPITTTSSDTHEVHLMKDIPITAAEMFLPIKILKAGKAAGCGEIQPEVLKNLNREGLG